MSIEQLNKKGINIQIGQRVYVPELDLYGEVVSLYQGIHNLIKEIKVMGADGKYTIIEVSDFVVKAVVILDELVQTNIFKRFWSWVTDLFRKKKQVVANA